MKQLTIIQLIIELIRILFKTGNVKVYYNIAGQSFDFPWEAEGVENRKTFYDERKVTIW